MTDQSDWTPLPTDLPPEIGLLPGMRMETHAQAEEKEYERQKRVERVRERIKSERADAEFKPVLSGYTVTDLLNEPDAPDEYTIDKLTLHDTNTLILGNSKAGKTTATTDLIRALADHGQFLGRYQARKLAGNIGYLNFEVGKRQMKQWFRESGIINTDRVKAQMLRGEMLDLRSDVAYKHTVAWLIEHQIEVLVIDPWHKFYQGTDLDNGREVGDYLDYIDRLKNDSGCLIDTFMPVHTPKNPERYKETPSGSGAMERWYDSMLVLRAEQDMTDGSYTRYIRAAIGRGEECEELLSYKRWIKDHAGVRVEIDAPIALVLNSEELKMLDLIEKNTGCSQSYLTTQTGWDSRKIKRITDGLAAKGRVDKEQTSNGYKFWFIPKV